MKSISITILIFFQVLIGQSQIPISAKVIPWKVLDNLDSLKILIRSSNSEIFSSVFYIDEFKHIDGEHPKTIIKFELNEAKKYVEFEVSYKYKNSFGTKISKFSLPEVLKVPVNNRELSIELEIHFQKYSAEDFNVISKEMIDRLIARKIYKLPDGIELIRSWENPKFPAAQFILYKIIVHINYMVQPEMANLMGSFLKLSVIIYGRFILVVIIWIMNLQNNYTVITTF